MKRNFTSAGFILTAFMLISQVGFSQAVGDFQTAKSGNWTDPTVWQRYNGTSWVAASAAPTTSDGVITILNTHTVLINANVTAKQLVVASGGTLNMNNYPTVDTLFIFDGPGTDLTVNGTLSLGGISDVLASTVSTSTMVVNAGGVMNWTSSTLAVATTISASATVNLTLDYTKYLNSNLTNSGTINWATGASAGGIWMKGSTFTNSATGVISEQFSSGRGFQDNGGTNTVINNGTITKTTTNTLFICPNFVSTFTFTNNGTIQGPGTVDASNAGVVNGTGGAVIYPGNPGISTLTVNKTLISGQKVTIKSNIGGTGAVAGTNYDQLIVSAASPVDITTDTLSVSITMGVTDPVGTTYTVLSVPSPGSISGTFAAVRLDGHLGSIAYTANTVTVRLNTLLPVEWGSFEAKAAADNTVALNWSTLQESNTAYFTVEYATDGKNFTTIGRLTAKGNSRLESYYSFTHNAPDLNATNYYRIRQVDLDGKATYSAVRRVSFNTGNTPGIKILNNPVRNNLQVLVQGTQELSINISDMNGKLLRSLRAQPGMQQIGMQDLPSGIYIMNVYRESQRLDMQKIIKY